MNNWGKPTAPQLTSGRAPEDRSTPLWTIFDKIKRRRSNMQVHSKFDRACVVLCGLWRIRSKKTEGAAGRVIAVPSQRSKWFSLLRPWLERRNARRERLDIWRLRLPRCMLPPLRLVHARNGSYKPPAPLKSRHRSAQRRRSIMLWSEMAVGRCRRRVDHARTDHFAQYPRCPPRAGVRIIVRDHLVHRFIAENRRQTLARF